MAKAKRPKRAPDVSKGPRPVQASKLTDRRPPKRGKSGSPLATGSAKLGAPTGTSQSGRPIKPALDASTVASSPAPRQKRGRKSKGEVEEPSQPMERRTLTASEQGHMALRAARLSVEARRRERKLKRETKAERDEIKLLRAQAEILEDQAEQGFELVPEGDLFADRAELEAGSTMPTTGQTAAALGEIARHIGGTGAPEDDRCVICGAAPGRHVQQDHDEHNKALKDAIKRQDLRAANTPADDIKRAANADAAGAHA